MEELNDRIARAVGSRPVRYVARAGGYSTADRYAVELAVAELSVPARPPNTASARASHPDLWERWPTVVADPVPFLSLGLRDEEWLERALPELLAAIERAPLDGDDLLHFDLRSDNMCFRDGKAVLVDWNWLCLGSSAADIAAWVPSVADEGGPPPWRILPGHGELAALIAGVWASVAGLPPPETAPKVREVQRRQLAIALDWVDGDLLS